jgi:protein phosphatase 1L
MILADYNLSLIPNAQRDPASRDKVKFLAKIDSGRIASFGIALLVLAEAVVRSVIVCLAAIAFCATLGYWKNAGSFASRHWQLTNLGCSIGWDFLISVFSSRRVVGLDQIAGASNGKERENRLRIGDVLIQGKLRKELQCAQNQMNREADDPDFHYLEGDIGSVEIEQVDGYRVGICHAQGRRFEMEDEHLATSFNVDAGGKIYPAQLFGVFDGHGGNEASKFLKEHLREKLALTLAEFNAKGLSDVNIWNALKMTFVRLNQEFNKRSGSTAVVAMIFDGKLWAANVGDSRMILVNDGQIVPLSEDADPADERYQRCIANRGGFVVERGPVHRVCGVIAVARALGDHDLEGAMSARPKITAIPLKEIRAGSHLMLGCDGIFDVASTRQVGRAIQENRAAPEEVLAKNMVYSAFMAGSQDNLSGMVLKLST